MIVMNEEERWRVGFLVVCWGFLSWVVEENNGNWCCVFVDGGGWLRKGDGR